MNARLGITATLAALAAVPAVALAQVQQVSRAPASGTTEIYDDKLVEGLPGPAGLYDLNDGQPQSLLSEPPPREVVFPGLGLPYEKERLDFRKSLYEKYGLTYALSYAQLQQYASRTLPGAPSDVAVGGWAALLATWTPIDRGGPNQGSLVVSLGWRGPIGGNPWPAPFGPQDLGMSWSSFTFTNWNGGVKFENLYWDQNIGGDLLLRIGNQSPQAILNTFRFKNGATQFTASPLEFAETIPYPAFGPGFSFRWRPSDMPGFYVNGNLNSMNGNPGACNLCWEDISLSQAFAGVEAGKQWRRANGEYDQLSLLVFHAGTRSILNPAGPNESGNGFKVLGEKQWGSTVGFANYTYNTARGGGISTTFSGNTATAGAAYLRPFGIRGEIAVAGMWTKPFKDIFPGSGQRDQYGVEAYWNLALTPNITLTPGIQWVKDPSFNPTVDSLTILSLKFRVAI